jgi:hypothetical protein
MGYYIMGIYDGPIYIYIQSVTERCGQILGTNSTYVLYQNKKKCSYQHVSGNI